MSEPVAWPECEEFYNLMQAYRHARIVDREATIDAYEAVKEWLRAEIARKDAAIAELVGVLVDAVEMVETWGAYADEYFQNKWNLEGDIAKLQAAIAKHSK